MLIWKIKRILRALTFYVNSLCVSRIPIYSIRHIYLRKILGVQLGKGVSVLMGVRIVGSNIEIGDRTVINSNVSLDGRYSIRIGSDCSISNEVCILSLSHGTDDPDFTAVGKGVVLGSRVWVGTRAMILPGVELGDGCVVGAGSVVTRSFPAYSVVAGVPAKLIKQRNPQLRYQLRYFPLFDTDITLDQPN